MKHLLLVLAVLVAGYGAWHVSPKAGRGRAARMLSHHGIRLGALVAAALAMLAVAYYASSTRIL